MRTEFKAEIAELRTETQTGFAEVRAEIAEMRTETRAGFAELRSEIADREARMVKMFAETQARTIRWTVGIVSVAVAAATVLVRIFG